MIHKKNLDTLTLFDEKQIEALKNNIFTKDGKEYIRCLIREKDVQVKPEELVRQLFTLRLLQNYNYPKEKIRFEYPVNFGSEVRRADIIILNGRSDSSVYCVIEIKKQKSLEGKQQLKSYTNATGSPLAVWTNGVLIDYYQRLDPNYFEPLANIPTRDQTIDDVKKEKFTYLQLMQNDRLVKEKKSLKSLIEDMENEVLSNAGVDVFEEVFKLIFTKLYDEMQSTQDRDTIETLLSTYKKDNPNATEKELLANKINDEGFRKLEFRSRGDAYHTKEVIAKLFDEAKEKWHGVFEKGEPLRN